MIHRSVVLLILLSFSAGSVAAQAQTKDPGRIAAVVNESVISAQDLERRVRLSLALSNIQDTPKNRENLVPQVLRKMIDERLQLQEGKRLGVIASGADVDARIGLIEQNSGMPSGRLSKELEQAGLDPQSLRDQIRADIVWAKLVVGTMGPQIRVGDEEVTTRLNQISSRIGTPEYLVAEVFLPVETPAQDGAIRKVADELIGHLRKGAPFSLLARQFSRAPSSASGGLLGWVSDGMVDGQILDAVRNLEKGQVAPITRTPNGYYVLALLDKRIAGHALDPKTSTVTLQQMTLPLPPDYDPNTIPIQALLQRAGQLAAQADSCEALTQLSKQLEGRISPRKTYTLADMPPEILKLVAEVPAGRIAPPVPATDSIKVTMVCDRKDATIPVIPKKEQIHDALENEKMEILGRRYLRDLRRSAFVDVRM